MQHVKTTLQSFDPEYPFNVRFFDEVLNGLYEKERSLSSLITLFSLNRDLYLGGRGIRFGRIR